MLAFGSDWPVAPMSPLIGIYAAVTRRTLDGKHPDGWIPEQKITVAEAVHAYTMGSAYASFDEKIKGSHRTGKVADLVVLSDDISAIDPEKIADMKVEMTMFGGRVVTGGAESLEKGLKRTPASLMSPPNRGRSERLKFAQRAIPSGESERRRIRVKSPGWHMNSVSAIRQVRRAH